MIRYVLSYDAKDASKQTSDELKLKIVIELLLNDAMNFHSPVASTIFFDDPVDGERLQVWNDLLLKHFGEKIFYYLCVVGIDKQKKSLYRIKGDPDLEKRFQDLIAFLN